MTVPWDWSDAPPAFDDSLYDFAGNYIATSATGSVLLPQTPYPFDDAELDAILQSLVTAITNLPGNLVRPRWQPAVPQQPSVTTNWCAIGVMAATPNDGPSIGNTNLNANAGTYVRHETLDILASFFGPNSKQYAALLRDGLAIPQNCDLLRANGMAFVEVGTLKTLPDLTNVQWIKRVDVPVTIRRKVVRNYAIEYLAIQEIVIIDDETPTAADIAENGGQINPPETVIGTIVVPPNSNVEP